MALGRWSALNAAKQIASWMRRSWWRLRAALPAYSATMPGLAGAGLRWPGVTGPGGLYALITRDEPGGRVA